MPFMSELAFFPPHSNGLSGSKLSAVSDTGDALVAVFSLAYYNSTLVPDQARSKWLERAAVIEAALHRHQRLTVELESDAAIGTPSDAFLRHIHSVKLTAVSAWHRLLKGRKAELVIAEVLELADRVFEAAVPESEAGAANYGGWWTASAEDPVISDSPPPRPDPPKPIDTSDWGLEKTQIEPEEDNGTEWLVDASADSAQRYRIAFGCNRKTEGTGRLLKFTGESGPLVYGHVEVSVPRKRKLGELPRPRWYLLEEAQPEKHFILQRTDLKTSAQFFTSIRSAPAAQRDSAFVFVHGYNVTFEDAALRTAQMAADLDIAAIPVFFSWPSRGNKALYTVDEQSVQVSALDLRQFLEEFADESGVSQVFVIAHSMGSRAATQALKELLRDRDDLKGKFGELILAAPDIDTRIFVRELVPGLAALHQRMTLYSSSKDKALAASKSVHGYARAGDSDPDVLVMDGVETIDASNIDTGLLGHSYIVNSRVLLTDVALLLGENLRANRRPTLAELAKGGLTHWQFKS